ncbi:MAG: dinB polymerase-4 [Candidatus Eisenbacteria bacterium]
MPPESPHASACPAAHTPHPSTDPVAPHTAPHEPTPLATAHESDERAVLHVDIDAFFAAIEQQRDPRLQGRPVIVGSGVIASCSYEARRFGLKAGMPLGEAKRLCPQAVVLPGHAQVYRCYAERLFERCRELSPDVETYLDEAYLELTGTRRLHGDFLQAAARLKQTILADTGLTVTCGIGPNRMLAKLVGKTRKPDGLARVHAAEAEAFLTARPIEQLAGVGHAHARTLRGMNIRTIGELRVLPVGTLEALFGAPGRLLHERCRGRDTAPVVAREVPLTISRETSFHTDTADPRTLEGMLEYLVGRACRTARELALAARTVSVRLRYSDGESADQARTLPQASAVDPVLLAVALQTCTRLHTRRVSLHAVGVTLSNFVHGALEQGSLFDEPEAGRRAALCEALDRVRSDFGHGAVVSGRALHLKGQVEEDRYGFVLRTSSLTK